MDEVQSLVSELSERLRQLMSSRATDQSLVRIEQSLPMINLLGWLSAQSFALRSYWQDRESDYKVAGLGRAWQYQVKKRADVEACFDQVTKRLSGSRSCLGYLSFSDSESMVWPGFGYGSFFFPVIEIVQTRKNCRLVCNLDAESEESWQFGIHQALEYLEGIKWAVGEQCLSCDFQPLEFKPNRSQWLALMEKTLSSFTAGGLQKVVLSREALLGIEGSLDPWMILQQWQTVNPRSYVFAFESEQGGELFFGCSPERLFRRVDRVVHTEALAGTTRRGGDQDEDFKLELRLLNDSKNIHENRLVLDDIRRRLNEICSYLDFDRSHSVVKLKTIQHLRHLIRGILNSDVDDGKLFSVLHPTPAVGGSGREEALEFIEHNESYSRGLYAGACGVIGLHRSEFTVSIRSALLSENSLSLFSGAGIVKGSDALDEWQELNNKITTLLSLLKTAGTGKEKLNSFGTLHDLSHQAS